MHLPMLSLSGGGGGGGGDSRHMWGICFFLKNFLSKPPPWGQKNGSNQVKSPYPGDKLY